MSIFDEKLLHIKFATLAEKCDTIEKMTSFCKSFLQKHSVAKESSPVIAQGMINNYVPPEILTINTNTSHYRLDRVYATYEMPDYLTDHEKVASQFYAKKEICYKIMDQLLEENFIEFKISENYSQFSTKIVGLVVVGRK